ncbi:MAG TPA: fasciclin domain-containing protein [Acidimicrobiia bacterium]
MKPTTRAGALLALALVAAGCGGDSTPSTTAPEATTVATTTSPSATEQMEEMGDVLEVAEAEGDLGTFLEALGAAGIMEDFHGEGPFTIFAPSDAAFETYLADAGMSMEEAFAGAEMLQSVLGYHVVAAMDDAEMVMGMAGDSFTTLTGATLDVTVDGETVMVGDATIDRYDIEASNGVIHVIDKVLSPPEA